MKHSLFLSLFLFLFLLPNFTKSRTPLLKSFVKILKKYTTSDVVSLILECKTKHYKIIDPDDYLKKEDEIALEKHLKEIYTSHNVMTIIIMARNIDLTDKTGKKIDISNYTEIIYNEIKEKAKNEFEEELNKELIIKEKEIKIKYNQKLENFKKKFRNELNEEYEKKKKEMKNQLNDIKSKIYRSRCSEKIKISKINKMKKNIGNYNEKNNYGIKKIDKILGNESDEDENNQNKKIDNYLPSSLKINNINDNNINEDHEYNFDIKNEISNINNQFNSLNLIY